MTKKKPANVTAEAWAQRQRVWRHNAYQGHCAMMESLLNAMINSDSTTELAKVHARGLVLMVPSLRRELKQRID